MPLLQAFPFPNTQGEVTLHQLSQTCVFVTAHVGGGSSLLSCGVFLPPALSQAFLLLVAGWALRVPPSPARPGLFIYSSGRDFPPQPFGGQGAPPSLLCVFIVLITYYSVSLFFPGWELVCPGGYADLAQGCLWEYRILLSSPCGPRLPKLSGHGCLAAAWWPSWFLHSMWSGDALYRLEVWRGQSFASSWWPCLQCVSPVCLQDFTLGGPLSASSL
jgi:hypothetical protein